MHDEDLYPECLGVFVDVPYVEVKGAFTKPRMELMPRHKRGEWTREVEQAARQVYRQARAVMQDEKSDQWGFPHCEISIWCDGNEPVVWGELPNAMRRHLEQAGYHVTHATHYYTPPMASFPPVLSEGEEPAGDERLKQ